MNRFLFIPLLFSLFFLTKCVRSEDFCAPNINVTVSSENLPDTLVVQAGDELEFVVSIQDNIGISSVKSEILYDNDSYIHPCGRISEWGYYEILETGGVEFERVINLEVPDSIIGFYDASFEVFDEEGNFANADAVLKVENAILPDIISVIGTPSIVSCAMDITEEEEVILDLEATCLENIESVCFNWYSSEGVELIDCNTGFSDVNINESFNLSLPNSDNQLVVLEILVVSESGVGQVVDIQL